MFYVVENRNFKLDPKHSFYRARRHGSQRAVAVQRVGNAQLEKLSPCSHPSTGDKSQGGAGSGAGGQVRCPQHPTGWRCCSRGAPEPCSTARERTGLKPPRGARTAPRRTSQGLKPCRGIPELHNGFYSCMGRGVLIIYVLVSVLM